MSLRRLVVLIRNLPADGALAREFNPDHWWDISVELSAQILERIDLLRLESLASRMSEADARKLPEVYHVLRPWEEQRRPARKMSPKADQVRFFTKARK